jgi:predicted 2-oxoglutarate/Fe(II)-dependent dioxygenase YbiX
MKDVLSSEECQEIIDAERPNLEKARFFNVEKKLFPALTRNSSVSWIRSGSVHDSLMHRVIDVIGQAAREAFDVRLNHFEPIQFSEYGIFGHYGKHRDSGTNGPSRWISATVELSDPKDYVGGGLWLDSEGSTRPEKKQGSVIVFPSILSHRALPVWWGKRNSLVLWGSFSNGTS